MHTQVNKKMEIKSIIKNENERKNLVWESIKDLKKNLNSAYSTNSSAFNTARSLKPISSIPQFPSSEEFLQNDYQEQNNREATIPNQCRFSYNNKENFYVSNHSQEEGAFSKIDTNLQEIPKITEQSFYSKSSNHDSNTNDSFNEFRRIPAENRKQKEDLEDDVNDFRKKSQNIRQEISSTLNELMQNRSVQREEEFNPNSFRKQEISSIQESFRKDDNGFINNIPKYGQKMETLTSQQSSFKKCRAVSSDIRNSTECEEYKKKSTKNFDNNQDQSEQVKSLLQENEELKSLVSRIRKENSKRIQLMSKEFEEQMREINTTNETILNEIKQKFAEEIASKEEDIQTMILVYKEEQSKNQQDEENAKMQENLNGEHTKTVNTLKSQIEEIVTEKNLLVEENSNLKQEFELLKNQNLQNLKDKQNELNVISEKYEKEIQSLKKDLNEKVQQTNTECLKKIDIFVKENIRLEDQVQKLEKTNKDHCQQLSLKDIQLDSLRNELKQTKEQLDREINRHQNQVVQEEIKQSQSKVSLSQKPQIPIVEKSRITPLDDITSQSYSTVVGKRNENEKENIRIHSINTPQVPSKNIYEQDKALKNLLAKIKQFRLKSYSIPYRVFTYKNSDFIEHKDTKDSAILNTKDNSNHNISTNSNSSQQTQKSSLNNHYNKKLRILRSSNNSNLNSSQIQITDTHRRGQSLVNQSLNDSYSSLGNYQQQVHSRNYSIERETNIKNPYLLNPGDSHRSQFFPHSKSNSNLNTQRRAVSTHLNTSQVVSQPQPQFERENNIYTNYNHNRSFFSENDNSKGNLDFLTVNQNIGNTHTNSRDSPLKIDEEFNTTQLQRQQHQFQSQINQDLSMISRAPYNENYSSCLNEYNYMSNKLQDKIEIRLNTQQQVFKLQEKENHPHFANSTNKYQNSVDLENSTNIKQGRNQLQSTQEIQQKLQIWDNMDSLAVDDEEQSGFMNTIKDLHSKIRLIKK